MKSSCLARSTDCGIAIQLPRTDRPTVIPGGENVKTGNLCAVFSLNKKPSSLSKTRNPEGFLEEVGNLWAVRVCCLFFTPENPDTLSLCPRAYGLQKESDSFPSAHQPIIFVAYFSSVKVGLKLQGCVEIEVFFFGSCVFSVWFFQ